jgi:ATP-dependent helicase/nuclease subunit B
MADTYTKKIYNIPAGIPFNDHLAAGLLAETKNHQHHLSQYLILLPTRRSCRMLQESFLRQASGNALLPPKMQAIGDIDAEELFLSVRDINDFDIPPAISPLKRQILLAQLISSLPNFQHGTAHNMALAANLALLMDQIHTENKNLKDLPDLVDRTAFADHWQITIDFLEILSTHWPQILEGQGIIDPADRRNRLINALNKHWQENPPQHPVIAAGTTGSIPSTSALLKTITDMPNGTVILPGLDQEMSESAWDHIQEGHPQATLKLLLQSIDCERSDIAPWHDIAPLDTKTKARQWLSSQIMLPAKSTDAWQKIKILPSQKQALQDTINDINLYECNSLQEEATTISLLLRETLENSTKTAALITPNRELAQRVKMLCQRWDIELDDSAGQKISTSPLGKYLRLCAHVLFDDFKSTHFLSLLKHDYCRGLDYSNFRQSTRTLEKDLMRGPEVQGGLEGLKQKYIDQSNKLEIRHKPNPSNLDFINFLIKTFQSFQKESFKNFSDRLTAHIKFAELLANNPSSSADENILWRGDAGEAASLFLCDLAILADDISLDNNADYIALFDQLISSVTFRPRYGTHPRLMILGQLEARMIKADRIILAGLNEGCWPPEPSHDPWFSRNMREDFGLPVPERDISLSAHDFVQGFCHEEIFLTRSIKIDGTPTVPARWLERLETFLKSIDLNNNIQTNGPHIEYARSIDKADDFNPIKRPAPCPPVESRPRSLSVTRIEKWLQDPYGIYAEKILKLNALDPLEKTTDAAQKGNFLHQVLHDFVHAHRVQIPHNAENKFITLSRETLDHYIHDKAEQQSMIPRLNRLASWFVNHEKQWRLKSAVNQLEVKGALEITEGLNSSFTLTGQADRIDSLHTGGAAIIDYKSGGTYSKKKIETTHAMQLPLEALMIKKGAFEKNGYAAQDVGYLGYWVLSGGKTEAKITALKNQQSIHDAIDIVESGLTNLIATFDDEKTPYYAIPRLDNPPRFNDFEHLERVKEWAALDDMAEESAA